MRREFINPLFDALGRVNGPEIYQRLLLRFQHADVARYVRMVSLLERMLELHKRLAVAGAPHGKTSRCSPFAVASR